MNKRYLEPDSTAHMSTSYRRTRLRRDTNDDNNETDSDNGSTSTNQSHHTNNLVNISNSNNGEMVDMDEDGDDISSNSTLESDNAHTGNEEIESDSDENDLGDDLNNLLHPNSNYSTEDSIRFILSYFLRHNLTWKAFEELIELIKTLCGSGTNLPASKYLFQKNLLHGIEPVYHFYCRQCNLNLGSYEDVKNSMKICSNCNEIVTLSDMNDGNFFVYISMAKQIEEIIANNESVLNSTIRVNSSGTISDYYDGELYKKLKAKHNNETLSLLITLSLNTGAVNVFKSRRNNAKLWPLQMTINELPSNIRYKSENTIMCGLWFGDDPNMAVFFKPFIEEIRFLKLNKFQYKNKTVIIRPLFATMESISKYKVLRMSSFNEKFGCPYCFHPGHSIEGTSASENNLRYKVLTSDLRTHSNTSELIDQFIETRENIKGIKGLTPLIAMPDFDLVNGVPIDYVDCILLGVVKELLNLWFDSTNHRETFYIGRCIEIVNENIDQVTLSHSKIFTRKPRSVTDRKLWNAIEHRSWLLYYGVPCLINILPIRYLKHFSLLSEGIWMLLKSSITDENYRTASVKLSKFHTEFEKLYGVKNMTFNVHLIKHLNQCVKMCGPLWTNSMFNFEDSNEVLCKFVNGTTDVKKQIVWKYLYNKEFSGQPAMSPYKKYIAKLSYDKTARKIGDVTIIGKPTMYCLTDDEKSLIQDKNLQSSNNVKCYKKSILNDNVFSSSSCSMTNDGYVQLIDGTYGQIDKIIESQSNVFLMINVYDRKGDNIDGISADSHLKLFESLSTTKKCVPISNVLKKCILVCTNNLTIITELPNEIESN